MKTITQIASLIDAQIEGDPHAPIQAPAALEEATEQDISFLVHPKYIKTAETSHAGAIILAHSTPRPNPKVTLLRCENPSKAFAKVCSLFAPKPIAYAPEIHPSAIISDKAILAKNISIQPGAVIEAGAEIGANTVIGANVYVGHHVRIGHHCHLYPNAVIREHCLLGNHVIIHAGAVIGADGFGFDLSNETAEKIPQIGIVRIDDRVEIGANTTIDRARFGQTWIQEGVKIDNLVQIAHNVVIGKNTLIAAQAGISGSTRLGQRVIVAGQVGMVGHIQIGDGAIIAAQAGVSKDIPGGVMIAGYHALPIREQQRLEASVRKLPELIRRVRELENMVETLRNSST